MRIALVLSLIGGRQRRWSSRGSKRPWPPQPPGSDCLPPGAHDPARRAAPVSQMPGTGDVLLVLVGFAVRSADSGARGSV